MTTIAPYHDTRSPSISITSQLIVLLTKTEGKPPVPVFHEHAKHHSSLKGMLQCRGACIVSAACHGETQRCRIVIIGGIRLFFTKRMCMLSLLHSHAKHSILRMVISGHGCGLNRITAIHSLKWTKCATQSDQKYRDRSCRAS